VCVLVIGAERANGLEWMLRAAFVAPHSSASWAGEPAAAR
jgi:hypothetical protein